MELAIDDKSARVQGFAPKGGVNLSGVYTPEKTMGVKLGADVNITIDNIVVPYTSGEGLILVQGVSYTFSSSVPCHFM